MSDEVRDVNETTPQSLDTVRAPLSAFLTVAGVTLLVAGTALFVAQLDAPGHYLFGSGLLAMSLGAIARWLHDPSIVVLPAATVPTRRMAVIGIVVFALLGGRVLQRGNPAGGIVLFAAALLLVAVIVDAQRRSERSP